MKIVKCPVTDRGVTLTDPEQGFIVLGNIYVAGLGEDGRPGGGLIGGGDWLKEVDESKIPISVFTKEEMLGALYFTPEEVETWARKKRNREGVVVMGPGESFTSEEGTEGEAPPTSPPR